MSNCLPGHQGSRLHRLLSAGSSCRRSAVDPRTKQLQGIPEDKAFLIWNEIEARMLKIAKAKYEKLKEIGSSRDSISHMSSEKTHTMKAPSWLEDCSSAETSRTGFGDNTDNVIARDDESIIKEVQAELSKWRTLLSKKMLKELKPIRNAIILKWHRTRGCSVDWKCLLIWYVCILTL